MKQETMEWYKNRLQNFNDSHYALMAYGNGEGGENLL